MKILFTLLVFALSVTTFAQDFSGRATYEKKQVLKIKNPKPEHETPEFKERLEAINKAAEKTHFLEFTQYESVYTEEEKLPTTFKDTNGNTASTSMREVWSKIYKNLKENYSLTDMDEYIVKDTLHTSGWELSTESKKIGNYTVYKATRIFTPKKLVDDGEETSNLLSMMDKKEPEDIVYTAWYTPEIPIPNGPEKFGGLPGLILELHTQSTVYLCSEIVLNPKKPIEIKVPKGKIISQEDYDKMREENIKKYRRESKIFRRETR